MHTVYMQKKVNTGMWEEVIKAACGEQTLRDILAICTYIDHMVTQQLLFMACFSILRWHPLVCSLHSHRCSLPSNKLPSGLQRTYL